MSLVINTNSAATLAANNLAASNQMLQGSLNRLSSGSKIVPPADDAGGLAVSMKLSAAARRQGATLNNIGNSLSMLQTQDGALNAASKVLNRISELKTLYSDVTKSSSDRANYNTEYTALKAQLTAISNEKFNGVSLFGSATMDVATTESGGGVVEIGGADLMGGTGTTIFSDNFANLGNWSVQNSTVSGNEVTLGDVSNIQRAQSLSGAFDVTFDFRFSVASNAEVGLLVDGFNFTGIIAAGSDVNDTASHSARFSFDGSGNVLTFVDGVQVDSDSGNPTSITNIMLQNTYFSGTSVMISNFAITTGSGTPTAFSTVANSSGLDSLNLSTVTSAIQELATIRADNGAQQSRLNFAAEILTTNKANMEAATSRIVDVDVATESTRLARYNVLVQAGTSMLSQANQSPQSILKLLG